jgi:hypothetical protein
VRVNLKITKSDIKDGERSNPSNCAIARSVKRNKNVSVKSVSVFHDVCILKKINRAGKISSYVASLPEKAQNFVRNFDHNLKVLPFALNLSFVKTSSAKASAIAFSGSMGTKE